MMNKLLIQQSDDDQDADIVALEMTSPDEQQISNRWKLVKLGEVVREFISGGTPSTKRTELWDGTVPWTTSATISEDAIILDIAQRFITKQGLQESASHLVPQGSLLVGTRVGVGKAVVNLLDIAISQDLTGIVLKTDIVQPNFIAYQFKTNRLQRIFQGYKRGTTIQGVSRFDLQSLKLYLPSLPEQRAIAHVLQTVQQATQIRRKELELERERKAALVHHLFIFGTRKELTKQSKIGNIPESWTLIQLGKVIASGPKNGIYKHQSHYGTGTNIIRINDFNNSGEIISAGSSRVSLLPNEIKEYQLKPDDILINRVNSISHLGKTALIGALSEDCVFESNMMCFAVDKGLVIPEYVFRFLSSPLTRIQIRDKARRAVAQSSINQGDVESILIPLCSLAEQKEIIDILSACDAKNQALEKEITLHEELFRALLEEFMTGRISTLPLIEQLEKGTLTHGQRTPDGTGTTH